MATPDRRLRGAVFDLDGVLTDTRRLHVAAWKEMIDAFLSRRARETGERLDPFDPQEEYARTLDGRPRYDGFESFLAGRGIALPRGEPQDDPGTLTVCGLANRKQALFLSRLERKGVEAIGPIVEWVRRVHSQGVATAMGTSSRNGERVVGAAGIADLLDALVDGRDLEAMGLAGKPAPDLFLEAARRIGVAPDRCALFEDARAGVEAGRRGGFGVVVGIAGAGDAHAPLLAAGADLVASRSSPPDEARLEAWLEHRSERRPSALGELESLRATCERRRPAFFLDYDGTLTPIVERPRDAVLSARARRAVERLARRFPLAIVSGRDRADVAERVGVPGVWIAGSHGFDIAGPDGERAFEKVEGMAPRIAEVARRLERAVAAVPGSEVEPKRFTVAVHYRRVAPKDASRIEAIVDEIVDGDAKLRKSAGKKVWEIRPDVDWDKGRAVLWLLEALDLGDADVLPVYVGDDVTDEDAFRALDGRGVGVLVGEAPRATAAGYALADPGEVVELLEALAAG